MKLPTISYDSAQVNGQDRKIAPAIGTNQIAGFGGFRPLASLEKIKRILLHFGGLTSLLGKTLSLSTLNLPVFQIVLLRTTYFLSFSFYIN